MRGAAKPHAPSRIGERTFAYDANGNQAGWVSTTSGQRRRNTWDEENRLQEVVGPSGTTAFAYDDAGQRILKRGEMGETVYVNQFYVVRNGAIATKHVFAGITRVASKLMPGESGGQGGGGSGGGGGGTHPGDGGGNGGGQGGGRGEGLPPGLEGREELPPGLQRQENLPPGLGGPARGRGQGLETAPGQQREPQSPQSAQGEQQQAAKQIVVDVRTDADRAAVTGQAQGNAFGGELPGEFLYFFHPDHLGSTSYVTDDKGALYEHLQYFPFGETWVQEGQPSQRIPYLFTSKELDEETGLYYFGARYYDPRTSLWVSADPAVEKYFPKLVDQLAAEKAGNKFDPEKRLPAGGGVFSSVNLGLYSYSANSPLTIVDPNGLWGIKAGVQMQEVQPRMTKLEALVDAIFQKHAGRDAIVTSGTEGKHTVVNSLHYVGLALDLRSNDIKSEKAKDSILNELKEELGPDFDVLLEFRGEGREHFHIEFQPTTQNSGDAGTDPMSSPVVLEPTSNDVTSAVQKFEQHTE